MLDDLDWACANVVVLVIEALDDVVLDMRSEDREGGTIPPNFVEGRVKKLIRCPASGIGDLAHVLSPNRPLPPEIHEKLGEALREIRALRRGALAERAARVGIHVLW